MPNLKTDYKDDVFSGKRKYNQINNVDGTVSFEDVTDYAQVGDSYGAAQINEINDTVNNINNKGYKNDDAAETSIADNDYFPFFDASANAKKNTLWSNIKSVLTNVFAIKNHAANSTVYGAGNANLYGHVKLSDSYASSAGAAASAVAASSKAVNDAFNTNKNSINSLSGTVNSNKTTETNHYNSLSTRATTLEGELTANGKRIYMDYKNGKYGINTSANRGADSFVPFNSLDDASQVSISVNGFGKYSHNATLTGFVPGEYYVIILSDGGYYGDRFNITLSGATTYLFQPVRRNPFDYWWASFLVYFVKATNSTITLTETTGEHDFESTSLDAVWQLTGV